MGYCGNNVVVFQHGLCPFGEIVNSHTDIFMATSWHGFALHKANYTFAYCTRNYYKV